MYSETGRKKMKEEKGKALTGIQEMDTLLRAADFAAENPGLSERLRRKIQTRLSGMEEDSEGFSMEYELSDDTLSSLAAAGKPEMQLSDTVQSLLRQSERGHS